MKQWKQSWGKSHYDFQIILRTILSYMANFYFSSVSRIRPLCSPSMRKCSNSIIFFFKETHRYEQWWLPPHSAGHFSLMPWVSLTFSYSILFEDVSVRNLQLKIQNTNQFPLVTATSFLPAEWGSVNDAVTFFFNLENPPPPHLHKLSAWMISSRRAIPIFFFPSSLQGGSIFFFWHAAFWKKNYILKPIPASFIMKVSAEMATE